VTLGSGKQVKGKKRRLNEDTLLEEIAASP
jgi:hypothetical protein